MFHLNCKHWLYVTLVCSHHISLYFHMNWKYYALNIFRLHTLHPYIFSTKCKYNTLYISRLHTSHPYIFSHKSQTNYSMHVLIACISYIHIFITVANITLCAYQGCRHSIHLYFYLYFKQYNHCIFRLHSSHRYIQKSCRHPTLSVLKLNSYHAYIFSPQLQTKCFDAYLACTHRSIHIFI